jgi:rhodanese-related sulfurtransferase
MALDESEREMRMLHLRAKLAAERQFMDVVRQVQENRRDFVLLDVRDRAAFYQGHIPGALSLPLDELDEQAPRLAADRQYTTYCWRNTCHLASRAALRLAELGFDVREMNAGWREWQEAGLPEESGPG